MVCKTIPMVWKIIPTVWKIIPIVWKMIPVFWKKIIPMVWKNILWFGKLFPWVGKTFYGLEHYSHGLKNNSRGYSYGLEMIPTVWKNPMVWKMIPTVWKMIPVVCHYGAYARWNARIWRFPAQLTPDLAGIVDQSFWILDLKKSENCKTLIEHARDQMDWKSSDSWVSDNVDVV